MSTLIIRILYAITLYQRCYNFAIFAIFAIYLIQFVFFIFCLFYNIVILNFTFSNKNRLKSTNLQLSFKILLVLFNKFLMCFNFTLIFFKICYFIFKIFILRCFFITRVTLLLLKRIINAFLMFQLIIVAYIVLIFFFQFIDVALHRRYIFGQIVVNIECFLYCFINLLFVYFRP